MAANDSGNLAGSLVEQIIAAEAVVKLTDVNVMMPLVTSIGQAKADSITVPLWNSGSDTITKADVAAHGEGTPLTAKALDSEKVTVTLDSYGLSVPFYDEAQYSSIEDLAPRIGAIGANAMSEYIDDMMTDLLPALGGGTAVGASTNNLLLSELFAALGTLKGASAPGPYNLVHKPEAIWGSGLMADLGNSTNMPGAVSVAEQASAAGFATTVAGIGVYSSPTVDVISTNYATGAVFSKEAILFGYHTPIMKVEQQRAATDLRTDYVFSMFSATSELEDSYGVPIKSKWQ